MGKDAEPLAVYRGLVAVGDDAARWRYEIGKLHYHRGRYQQAVEELRAAIRCAPGVPRYREELKRALALRGKPGD